MKKKIISLAILCVLALSAGIYYYVHQPKNIFDEIYQETQKTYQSNNILGNIKGFDIDNIWPTDDPNIVKTPSGQYIESVISNGYSNVRIGFNFRLTQKTVSISFKKELDSKVSLSLWSMYSAKDQTLTKTIEILIKENDSNDYIDNESEVKSYLKKYGITTKDLDSYYDKIVNQKVLKDWCSIYDSKFSPENYGDVTVKTQWKDW
ncbi:TipC family immunity protein [Streptococcus ferus]|uniref:TipC family immunity protein n=1 Tax=Streptococcus ferus TaxID=1345 RepID=UPI0035A18ABE